MAGIEVTIDRAEVQRLLREDGGLIVLPSVARRTALRRLRPE